MYMPQKKCAYEMERCELPEVEKVLNLEQEEIPRLETPRDQESQYSKISFEQKVM